MATVTLDCSEYDMLRTSKLEAERKIEELKAENESFRNNSYCLIKSRTYGFDPDDSALQEFCDQIREFGRSFRVDNRISTYIRSILECSRKKLLSETTEVIGFEEVRSSVKPMIEEEYRAEMESRKDLLSQTILSYESKERQLETKYNDNLKAEEARREDLENSYKEMLRERDEIISLLQNDIKELSKTQEEKEKEALLKIQKAEEELARLKESVKSYQPEGYWHSLFSRIFK